MSNNFIQFYSVNLSSSQPLSDPYWTSVKLLTHLDGADGSTTFTDVKGHAFTKSGTVTLSATQSKFGGTSLYCNGGYIYASSSPDFNFGTGDFTLEAWIYPTASADGGILCNTYNPNSANINMVFLATGKIRLSTYTSVIGDGSLIVNLNEWTHVAVSRNGSKLYLWVNGQLAGAFNYSSSFSDTMMYIGSANKGDNAGAVNFRGYIDEARVTKGVARYTASFSVPTDAFPNS